MKSLSFRLTVWYACIVTLTVAGVLFVGRFSLESHMISGIDLLNEVEFEEIRARLDESEGDPERLVEVMQAHAELDAALYFFQIGGGEGAPLFKSSNLGAYQLPNAVYGQATVTATDEELGPIRSAEFNYEGLDVYIASSLENLEILFAGYRQTSYNVCAGVFLLSLVFGYFLSRLAIRPIVAIQTTAKGITASNLNERIPVPNTGDEVAEMAQLLNAMLDRLEVSYQQVKRFTAEASHEFRTPLSIIRLQAERLLEQSDLSGADRRAALLDQMEEVGRLNKIIEDLLFLAKADSGIMPLNMSEVDLRDYLADLESDCRLLAEESEVAFVVKGDVDVEWNFDAVWIRNVLLNLFMNALAASERGQTVELIAKVDERGLCFQLQDEGAGVSEAQLEIMFNRFERLKRAVDSKGNGLGLAICRSVLNLHGGSISAMNRRDRTGLCVEVVLPRSRQK
jgi:signal transduction histidine kinase